MTTKDKNKLIRVYNNRGLYFVGAIVSLFIFACNFIISGSYLIVWNFVDPKTMRKINDIFYLVDVFWILVISLTTLVVFGFLSLYLFRKIDKIYNYQIVKFHFLRKDFKPHIYYGLCPISGRFKVLATFKRASRFDKELVFDSLLQINPRTTDRIVGEMRDKFIFPVFKVKIGFINLVTPKLLQAVFNNSNVFKEKVRIELEKALPIRLQDLGFSEGRVSKYNIKKVCKGLEININGVEIKIADAFNPSVVNGQAEFFHPNNPLLKKQQVEQRERMDQRLKKVLELKQKQKSAERAD